MGLGPTINRGPTKNPLTAQGCSTPIYRGCAQSERPPLSRTGHHSVSAKRDYLPFLSGTDNPNQGGTTKANVLRLSSLQWEEWRFFILFSYSSEHVDEGISMSV